MFHMGGDKNQSGMRGRSQNLAANMQKGFYFVPFVTSPEYVCLAGCFWHRHSKMWQKQKDTKKIQSRHFILKMLLMYMPVWTCMKCVTGLFQSRLTVCVLVLSGISAGQVHHRRSQRHPESETWWNAGLWDHVHTLCDSCRQGQRSPHFFTFIYQVAPETATVLFVFNSSHAMQLE